MSASYIPSFHFLAFFIATIVLIPTTAASADFKVCCIKAARRNFDLYDTLPWETCGIGSNITVAPGESPSVNATLGWCRSNCPGHQPSTTAEWLHPITTWIVPYIGLLFLCPTGELGLSNYWMKKPWMSKRFFKIMEYAGFLGDPASAIFGAFSELAEDWWLSVEARRKNSLKRELLIVVILVGQTELTRKTERKLTNAITVRVLLDMLSHHATDQDQVEALQSGDIDAIQSGANSVATSSELRRRLRSVLDKEKAPKVEGIQLTTPETGMNSIIKTLLNMVDDEDGEDGLDLKTVLNTLRRQIVCKNQGKDPGEKIDNLEALMADVDEVGGLNKTLINILNAPQEEFYSKEQHIAHALLREGTFAHRLWDGVRTSLEARVDFTTTILIPIILLLVVTAAVFYDAYQSLGDNMTAHSLAYGLVYSWLIILAVAGNCFTTSLSPGLIERTIGEVLPLSDTTVRLSERYVNALRWRFWMVKVGIVEGHPDHPTKSGKIRFLLGQLFGWICVAIAASCAAAISYTTPTVGIGCRSFNFLLYALVSLIIALIPPAIYWREGVLPRQTFGTVMIWIKRVLMFCNIVIIIGGTLFHLSGLFHSCMCMNLFVSDSRILQLNANTKHAVDNANTYWLSVGYIAFIFIWLVCAVAIIMRQYISLNISLLQEMNVDDNRLGVRSRAKEAYRIHYLKGRQEAKKRLQTGQKAVHDMIPGAIRKKPLAQAPVPAGHKEEGVREQGGGAVPNAEEEGVLTHEPEVNRTATNLERPGSKQSQPPGNESASTDAQVGTDIEATRGALDQLHSEGPVADPDRIEEHRGPVST